MGFRFQGYLSAYDHSRVPSGLDAGRSCLRLRGWNFGAWTLPFNELRKANHRGRVGMGTEAYRRGPSRLWAYSLS